jgi:hypothetical protein
MIPALEIALPRPAGITDPGYNNLPPRYGIAFYADKTSNGRVTFATERGASALVYNSLTIERKKMKDPTPIRIRIRRFITDRIAYREQPNFLSEFVAFGILVFIAGWPIILMASTMARMPR